jgi:anti-sigma factor RsiW
VQEVDELRATNKALRAEVAALSADKGHLQQACDSRSSHAMTLIAENKRLIEQVGKQLMTDPLPLCAVK